MTNIDKIKSIASDAEKLSQFHKKYPRELRDYQALYGASDVDKYGMGFNQDERFSACNAHRIWFDTHKGYFGSSSCSRLLSISNAELFWKSLDKYLNEHQEEIFQFISNEFKKELAKKVSQIDEEITSLTKLKEDVTSKLDEHEA